MASLKNHPGMWLRDDAAAAINALEDKYGPIVINSAGRTIAEQEDLIRRFDRGEPGIFIPARPPETSTHVRDGGIAVDVYNYTSDRHKLQEFGFEWYGPNDRVHYTFRGWRAPASPASPSPTPTPSEEDDMIALRIRDDNGTLHMATLGLKVFRHLIESDDPERMKNIVKADDQWTDVHISELPRLLKTYGCRTDIYRVEPNGAFVVRDVDSGQVMSGGMWCR